MVKECPMRHENGNCLPAGGFCPAVREIICEALQNAYQMGYTDMGIRAKAEKEKKEVKHGEWFDKGSLSCRCSNCGCKSSKESKFCSECGADMRERKETE